MLIFICLSFRSYIWRIRKVNYTKGMSVCSAWCGVARAVAGWTQGAAKCVCVSCAYYGACLSFKDKHMVSESGLSHRVCIEAFREKLQFLITGGIQEAKIGAGSGKINRASKHRHARSMIPRHKETACRKVLKKMGQTQLGYLKSAGNLVRGQNRETY